MANKVIIQGLLRQPQAYTRNSPATHPSCARNMTLYQWFSHAWHPGKPGSDDGTILSVDLPH
jgi:hypothetical protein